MDPRELHDLVDQIVQYSRGMPPPPQRVRRQGLIAYDARKRYATYFAHSTSLREKWDFADDESTWEFSAPVAPISRSSSSTGSTCDTAYSTPAQEIVLRYRAKNPLDFVDTRSSSQSSSCSDVSWEAAPTYAASISSDYAPIVPEKDIKAVYRRSRYDALEGTREEAIAVMKRCGKTENDSLVCHRPDCRDTLQDVKALMYHLHIHNIHDQSLICPTCDKQFEHADELGRTHRCPDQPNCLKLPPASPLKEGFFRVLGKIGCRN